MGSHRVLQAGILSALGIGAALATCSAAMVREPGVRPLALAGLGIEAGLVLIALSGALLSSRPLAESLGLLRSKMSGSRLLLLVAGTLALSHALDCLLELSGLLEHSALEGFKETLDGARGSDLALALLAMAIAPALGEELLCRGWIQRSLEPRLGAAPSVSVAALIFGALHLDPVHALFALFLGLYLGTIASWAGSTWPSILCHGVNNTLAVLLAAGLPDGPPHGAVGAVLGLALAAGVLMVSRPRRGQQGAAPAHPVQPTLQPEARSDDP